MFNLVATEVLLLVKSSPTSLNIKTYAISIETNNGYKWETETTNCLTRDQLLTLTIITSLYGTLSGERVREMLKDMPTCPKSKP